MGAFKIYSPSCFQVCSPVLLTAVTMWHAGILLFSPLNLPLMDQEIEALSGKVTCLRSHPQKVREIHVWF